MNRRTFLSLIAAGLAAPVAASGLVDPRRKIWQVSRNAPVGHVHGPHCNLCTAPPISAHDLRQMSDALSRFAAEQTLRFFGPWF